VLRLKMEDKIMDFLETLAARNADFADHGFAPELKIIPSERTMIIGCVDPRVDPMDVLQLKPGEAVVVRNVGGRVTPALIETMTILRTVAQAAGKDMGAGWNLILLQHTDCGIKGCYHHAPELLAPYMGVPSEELDGLAITDPHTAVGIDIARLRAVSGLPGAFRVTGLVYDVATGTIETVVPAALLRDNEA
jgi:carbonic anhydrase